MMKRDGEMTTREAAELLGVHIDTVVRWAKEAVAAQAAERSGARAHAGLQLRRARVEGQRKVPRYYVDAEEVRALTTRTPGELA